MKKIMIFLCALIINSVSMAQQPAGVPLVAQLINELALDPSVHYIGENYGGGIVFYIYDNTDIIKPGGYEYRYPQDFQPIQGRHGLIATEVDQNDGMSWWSIDGGKQSFAIVNGVGAGKFNTNRVTSIDLTDGSAAFVCATYPDLNNHSNTEIPHADWVLPSKWELNEMHKQRMVLGMSSDENKWYWSSTEADKDTAYAQKFDDSGIFGKLLKKSENRKCNVRCVRYF